MTTSDYATDFSVEYSERQTPRITGVLRDAAGVAIPAAGLTSLVVTLYDEATGPGSPINSRADQNILNANGGTVDTEGNLVFQLTLDDQAIVNTDRLLERHSALFRWTYNAGAQGGVARVSWLVRNEAAVS